MSRFLLPPLSAFFLCVIYGKLAVRRGGKLAFFSASSFHQPLRLFESDYPKCASRPVTDLSCLRAADLSPCFLGRIVFLLHFGDIIHVLPQNLSPWRDALPIQLTISFLTRPARF